MKTLLLTNEYPPNGYGGAGVHVDYLSRELAKLIDVDVRCFGEQDGVTGRLHVKGYSCNSELFALTDAQLRSPLQALERCIRFSAAPTDANVVHCHTWYTAFGGIVTKLAYGLPLVITAHSLEPLRPWKREQLGRGYALSCWLEQAAMNMADHVIAVSAGMKQDIVRIFGLQPDRVSVIYNGIDTNEYRRVTTHDALSRFGIDPAVPYVLFVGRLTRQKGLVHLLEALPYISRDANVVVCAGAPDTTAIAEEVGALVRDLQQRRPGLIWIPEMVHKRAVIELYSHAAIFCCPSIYEPFGIINLEAMACGTPVVASAIGGIPEVVLHGETGFLVTLDLRPEEPFSPTHPERFARDLASAINALLQDEALRRKMGAAARARVEQNFSWPAVARQVVELYETLVASGGTPT